MKYLKPTTKFSLNDSDKCTGGLLSEDDVKQIFNLTDFDIVENKLKFKDGYIDEYELQKFWYKNHNELFDEIFLSYMIKMVYPQAVIENQVRIKRFVMDLKVTYENQVKFVEFDGIHHFKDVKYGKPKSILLKKQTVEDITGIEVINWTFWISKSKSNILRIFNKSNEIKGIGAIFTSPYLFGDFDVDDCTNIIKTVNKRFNCDSKGCGYFYNNYNQEILKKYETSKFIPKDYIGNDLNYWLPEIKKGE
jgi:hypothetical protein